MKARVNGTELYYELRGKPQGDRLVFLNGLLMDLRAWEPLLFWFSPRFSILLYDMRGQGRSEKPEGPYPIPLHAQDLRALLDFLDWERVSLIGLSSGAAVALSFAASWPERVAKMVLVGAYAHVDAVLRAKLRAWLEAAKLGSTLRFIIATPWVWGNDFLERYPDLYAQFQARAEEFSPEAACALIAGAGEHDVRSELPKIRAPTLLLVGEEDIFLPPRYAQAVAERLPCALVHIVPQAGHALPFEFPEVFAKEALAFLEGHHGA
jgi:3-oxoadipate enol-lactonase